MHQLISLRDALVRLIALSVLTIGIRAGAPALELSSNYGTEFYFSMLPLAEMGQDRVILNIVAAEDCLVNIECVAAGYAKSVSMKAGFTQNVEISLEKACAYTGADSANLYGETTLPQRALHIRSNKVVSIRCQYRSDANGEGFLVLPTSVLSTRYIVHSLPDMSWMYGSIGMKPSYCTITATRNNTDVVVKLGGNSLTQTCGGMTVGQTKTLHMDAGDVVVISTRANSMEGDISGTTISATQAVAVVSGNMCANMPSVTPPCNFVAEMELPTAYYGLHYAIPRNTIRTNGMFMKMSAAQANTHINYNGTFWHSLQTSGGTEGRGWIYQRVDGSGNKLVSLSSEKPIAVMTFNPSRGDDLVDSWPYAMSVVPFENFSKGYQFSIENDTLNGYTRCCVGFVYPVNASSEVPDDLEYCVVKNGVYSWRSVAADFGKTVSQNDLYAELVDGKRYAYKEVLLTNAGVYAFRCGSSFGCYQYGDAPHSSYGQPVGMSVHTTSPEPDVVAPQLVVSLSGLLIKGTVHDLPGDPIIRSNLRSVYLDAGSTNCALRSPGFFDFGVQDASVEIEIQDPDRDALALLVAVDRAGNMSRDTIRYAAGTVVHPTVMRVDSSTICAGGSVQLILKHGVVKSITWSNGAQTDTVQLSSLTAGTHSYWASVKTINDVVMQSDTVSFIVWPLPATPSIQQNINLLSTAKLSGAMYDWYFNSKLIAHGIQYDTLSTKGAGRYKVRVTDLKSGCSSESAEFVGGATAVSEQTAAFNIYPDVLRDWLTIECVEQDGLRCAVYTLLGQEVLRAEHADQATALRVDLRSLPNGQYLVRCMSTRGEYYKSVLKID